MLDCPGSSSSEETSSLAADPAVNSTRAAARDIISFRLEHSGADGKAELGLVRRRLVNTSLSGGVRSGVLTASSGLLALFALPITFIPVLVHACFTRLPFEACVLSDQTSQEWLNSLAVFFFFFVSPCLSAPPMWHISSFYFAQPDAQHSAGSDRLIHIAR